MKQLWTILLDLADKVSNHSGGLSFCCFNPKAKDAIFFDAFPENQPLEAYILVQLNEQGPAKQAGAGFRLKAFCDLELQTNQFLSAPEIAFLKTYLPYCFLSLKAKLKKRAISIAHFAQTLDGKIATEKGDSRWIGNKENLDHAHRMRALCDAIMIGKNTLQSDLPRLTVRRVEGKHPKRVVLASPDINFKCLLESNPDPVIVIGKEVSTQNGNILYYHLKSENGCIKSNDILECLFQQGINTVYIEGGAITTSNFIKDRSLDILQLHLSPSLFGSGKKAFILPGIQEVEEGVQFRNFSFHKIGDTLMFVGEPV